MKHIIVILLCLPYLVKSQDRERVNAFSRLSIVGENGEYLLRSNGSRLGILTNYPQRALHVNAESQFQKSIYLVNDSLAASGTQRSSPALILDGQGWKTTAPASGQSVKFSLSTLPIQGTTSPTGDLLIKASINNGAYNTIMRIGSSSNFNISSTGIQINRSDGNTGGISLTGDGPAQNVMYVGGGFKLQGTTSGSMDFTGAANIATSGTMFFAKVYNDFSPTSGTATYGMLDVSGVINQTGGASGITRGVQVNAFLQAAADFRAFESLVNAGHAFYQGGSSASNYFAGETKIGSATDQGAFTLQNTGGLYQSGTVHLRGIPLGSSSMNVLLHNTDSNTYQISAATLVGSVLKDSAGYYTIIGTTTDATPTNLTVISLPNTSMTTIEATCIAIKNDGTSGFSAVKIGRYMKDNVPALVSGASTIVADAYSGAGLSTATFTLTNSGTNAAIQVTGEAATTIQWKIRYKILQTSINL